MKDFQIRKSVPPAIEEIFLGILRKVQLGEVENIMVCFFQVSLRHTRGVEKVCMI